MSPQPTGELDTPVMPVLDLAALGAAHRPQVNLLPPEVNSRRALGKVKRLLVLAFLGVVVLALGGVAYGWMTESTAAAELALKQAEVTRLQDEQLQYAEVPQIKAEVARVTDSRTFGMTNDVIWKGYVQALQAVTPQGVTLQTVTLGVPSPGEQVAQASNPLATANVGEIVFTARSTSLPNLAAWIEAVNAIPGLSDTTFSTANLTGGDGQNYYDFSATVVMNDGVFSHRYDPVDATAEVAGTADDAAGKGATDTGSTDTEGAQN